MSNVPSNTGRGMAAADLVAALAGDRDAATPSDLDQLLSLARQRSREGRAALFDTVRDLLFDTGEALSDRERTLMGDILRRLVSDVEMSVRRDLAERLAQDSRAPHDLVVAVANDEIDVAFPILATSTVLADADLVEIIRHRTQSHQLAIAGRHAVSEEVSAALVNTGDQDVVITLLNNEGAQIAAATMEYLVDQSRQFDAFQEPLVRRHDLPRDLARNMYMWVSAALRHHLAKTHEIDGDVIDETIESVVRDQFGERPEDREHSIAERIARDLKLAGNLNEAVLLQFLRKGEIPLFEAGLAALLELRPRLVRRILFEPGPEALAIACRAAGFQEVTFKTIVRLTRLATRREKDDVEESLRGAVAIYRQIKPSYATAVARRWRRDPQYQYALNKVEAAN